MPDNLGLLQSSTLMDKKAINNSVTEAIIEVARIQSVGNISLQVFVTGAGSSVTFTYQLSNDYEAETKVGRFTTPASGNALETITATTGSGFFAVSTVNCQAIKIIATETLSQAAVVEVVMSVN